jgi:DNA-binding MarR family transcriptional regulator
MERCDGEHRVADIAAELGIPFSAVWEVIAKFLEKGLVSLSRIPNPTSPGRSLE